MIDTDFHFYEQITDHPQFAKHLFGFLFERYRKRTERESRETASLATEG